jgi:purine-cytosine permease-like protein
LNWILGLVHASAALAHDTLKQDRMNKLFAIALLVGGLVLIVMGINATNSFSSDVSRFFTGSPTDKAIWFVVGGIVAALFGLVGTLRSSNHA